MKTASQINRKINKQIEKQNKRSFKHELRKMSNSFYIALHEEKCKYFLWSWDNDFKGLDNLLEKLQNKGFTIYNIPEEKSYAICAYYDVEKLRKQYGEVEDWINPLDVFGRG